MAKIQIEQFNLKATVIISLLTKELSISIQKIIYNPGLMHHLSNIPSNKEPLERNML